MSSRVFALACVLSMGAGCSRQSPPPGPPPAPASAPAADGIRMTEVIARSPERGRALPDTGRLAEARQAARDRAAAAGRLVDTIVATPDTIALEAGESVFFLNAVRFEGRDSTGALLPGLTPRLSLADQNIARFAGGELVGVSVGRTVLRVEAAVPGAPPGVRPRTRTEIPVVVRPARAVRASAPVDSVPRDLVVALLGGGIRPVNLRVGAAANGLPEAIFRDSRVLGSAHVGNTATTAAVMPFSSRVVLDTIDARLAADGWRPPRPPAPMRGFVPAQTSFGGYGPGQACRNGEYLSTLIRARAPNETLVVVSQRRMAGTFGLCADSGAADPRRSMMDDFPVPLLLGPSDGELESRGSSGGGDYMDVRALLRGSAPLLETLQHFGEQLRRQGWTATDSSTTRDLGVQTFRHAAADGRRWLGLLMVVAVGDAGPRQVSFRLIRIEP
ncbi:MAG TPA: hypothetical protein VLE53_13300 [Gemmatimonadaceae bacterium]|nr:hypothetical protein [Gemmatimonadaceae bacterium]